MYVARASGPLAMPNITMNILEWLGANLKSFQPESTSTVLVKVANIPNNSTLDTQKIVSQVW